MKKINRKDDKRVYLPRIRASRIKDLYEMRVFLKMPMTVLVDEALSVYLSAFFTSPEYKTFRKKWIGVLRSKITPSGRGQTWMTMRI